VILGNAAFEIDIRMARGAFFNRRAVTGAVSLAKRKVLSKFGAFVRTRARSLMRPARMKSRAEMSSAEIIVYEEKKRYALRVHGPTPRRPMASSKPGDPPRVILGLLKQHLYFSYDADKGSVVIGPAKLNGTNSNAPEVLEHGGWVRMPNGRNVWIEARPFMSPSFEAEMPGVPMLWAGALDGNGL
jgi:hypothetical protein